MLVTPSLQAPQSGPAGTEPTPLLTAGGGVALPNPPNQSEEDTMRSRKARRNRRLMFVLTTSNNTMLFLFAMIGALFQYGMPA